MHAFILSFIKILNVGFSTFRLPSVECTNCSSEMDIFSGRSTRHLPAMSVSSWRMPSLPTKSCSSATWQNITWWPALPVSRSMSPVWCVPRPDSLVVPNSGPWTVHYHPLHYFCQFFFCPLNVFFFSYSESTGLFLLVFIVIPIVVVLAAAAGQ